MYVGIKEFQPPALLFLEVDFNPKRSENHLLVYLNIIFLLFQNYLRGIVYF